MCRARHCIVLTARNLLWLINAAMAAVGGLLVVTAAFLLHEFHSTENLNLVERNVTFGLLLTGVGICSLALFGCVGTVQELSCALRTYVLILLVLVVVEAMLISTLLEFIADIDEEGVRPPESAEHAIRCAWDICCLGQSFIARMHKCDFDESVCRYLPEIFTSEEQCSRGYYGYESIVIDWMRRNLQPATIILIFLSAAQLLAILLACCLSCVSRATGRDLIVIIERDESGELQRNVYARLPHGSQNRRAREDRTSYRQLRSFFTRKNTSRREALLDRAHGGAQQQGARSEQHHANGEFATEASAVEVGSGADGDDFVPVARVVQ